LSPYCSTICATVSAPFLQNGQSKSEHSTIVTFGFLRLPLPGRPLVDLHVAALEVGGRRRRRDLQLGLPALAHLVVEAGLGEALLGFINFSAFSSPP
jgi:hypothetical protein